MSYGSVTRIPKGLHHLEPAAKTKFTLRYPARAPRPSKAYIQPKDRVARWNIVPGDKVRVMVGKAKDKFNDETQGSASGWKVYTVHSIDMSRSRVYLNGLTNKKANPIRPPPANLAELSEEDQKQWTQQRNFIDSRRAVQYSNVQLCVEEKGPQSVFATRIATSEPFFNTKIGRFEWKRFAANLTGETEIAPDAARGQVTIPWPKIEKNKAVEPTTVDTVAQDASQTTLALGPTSTIPPTLIPNSLRAPLPKDQLWSNEYVFNPAARPDASLQAAMPLYLAEELSPRFSRAKKMKGWKARREMEAIARDEHVQAAVEEWEAAGRDAGLEEILATNAVNLEGATIRSRTRREVREAAGAEFDEALAAAKGENARAAAAGDRWDYVHHKFVPGDKGLAAIRKRVRKQRKARKIIERLENLTLTDAKNQVIPPGLGAN